MGKEALKNAVEQTLHTIAEYEERTQQAKEAENHYRPAYKKSSFLILIIVGIGFVWMMDGFVFSVMGVLAGLLSALIVGVPFSLLLSRKENQQKRNSLQESRRLQSEADRFLEERLEKAMIPIKYCNTEALHRFAFYLDNDMVNNLKECIDLYQREETPHWRGNKSIGARHAAHEPAVSDDYGVAQAQRTRYNG